MTGTIKRIFLTLLLLSACAFVYAQEGAYGAYSPYSIYGIGDITKEGTAFNKGMGGTGIATRNRRFINYLNPAAVTARDSLSFMADFGLAQNNKVFRQGDMKSANNTFNIYDFVLSFPIYRSSAFMVGITPFSDVGYNFSSIEKNPEIIGNTGNIEYDSYGNGSVYQLFFGAGVTLWKNLSLGAEGIYYFGNIDKITNMNYSNSSFRSINGGNEFNIHAFTGKLGVQYQQKIKGNVSMIVGATYRLGTKMKGYSTEYRYANLSNVSDTLRHRVDTLGASGLRIADEIGLGISFKGGERWSAEFNYLRSSWNKSGFDGFSGLGITGESKFTSTASQSFRAGFEITPNRNDIRYFLRRCTYRAGVYYDQAYYKLDGNNVNSTGITLGITLPVFRWYNGLSLGIDLGQKSSAKHNMIRERYAMFVVGFNIHDIWFQKQQYN
ncbi:MAG: hypothetical protein IJ402_01490 [Bacteroidales bacterium]|nr:hypothetical protein [Bacteroidales bacterium]